MHGRWWHCACGSLPVLFPSSQASSFLLSNIPSPNPFHQSISPACLRGWCSLAIDALIAVGHIEKIVLLVVILQGEKGRKPCNSLHVKTLNQEIIVTTRGHNLSFAVSPPLHRRLHFLIPKRVYSNSLSLATALFLNSGTSHFWT